MSLNNKLNPFYRQFSKQLDSQNFVSKLKKVSSSAQSSFELRSFWTALSKDEINSKITELIEIACRHEWIEAGFFGFYANAFFWCTYGTQQHFVDFLQAKVQISLWESWWKKSNPW